MSKAPDLVKRLLLGRALRSAQQHEQTLPKTIALPVFASDALSSVAYAPQEILIALGLAGLATYHFTPWVAGAVIVILLTVVASYRQNVRAYTSGGGDFEVATSNLGSNSGIVVASALLVDYVMTVVVSPCANTTSGFSARSTSSRSSNILAVSVVSAWLGRIMSRSMSGSIPKINST